MGEELPSAFVLAVDLGSAKIQSSVVDENGQVLSVVFTLTEAHKGPGRVIEKILTCLSDAMKQSKADPGQVQAIGISCPGPLSPETGVVFCPPGLPGWDHIGLAKMVSERTSLPCFLDTDVRMGVLGESAFGAAKGCQDAVFIFLGSEISGGLIASGKLLRGFGGGAGEIGHMVIAAGMAACPCGGNGCLNALASHAAMVKRITWLVQTQGVSRELEACLAETPDPPDFALAKLYQAGDGIVVPVVDEASVRLGVAVGSVVNLFSPEVVVLGGAVIEALWDVMSRGIQDHALRQALPSMRNDVRIIKAQLGDDARVIGASQMARDRLPSYWAERDAKTMSWDVRPRQDVGHPASQMPKTDRMT